ncbi:MAG TPA: FMN-binding negative transcriptional regulator [Rhodocyclaceae bacterium]|nr:FMN-binding negative transcriptional regulator [Rhodocyclaceae bacterium]
MYLPKHFEESSPETLHAFIDQHPLATIVVGGEAGLAADHIPLFLRRDADIHGELIGHVARANPLSQKAAGGIDCLILFHGQQHYISPNWYATKAETGKAVPTWNYEVVHVQGKLFAMDDPVWLRACLTELSARHERTQAKPWTLDEAPAEYIDNMLKAIVGIRVEITSMVGKAKLSQNQPPANRKSVIDALSAFGDEASLAMAEAIRRQSNDRRDGHN